MKPIAIAAAALGLAACGQPEPAQEAATEAAPAAQGAPSEMPGASAAKTAKGTGTVTEVGEGSITLNHAPIPEAGWPAMTMAFKASPEVARQVKVGDQVAFDLKLEGGTGEITAVQKQ